MGQVNKATLVGFYGGDREHAQAAWTSTGTDLESKLSRIPALLTMLAEGTDGNPHTTPFERSLLHYHLTVDTATHIHILKHRVLAVNGESARYAELKEDKYLIPSDFSKFEQQLLKEHIEASYKEYHHAVARLTPVLGRKRAKESARFYLPYGIQINLDISMSFRALVGFLKLRNAPSAQKEVRELAAQMLDEVKTKTNGKFEHSLKAFGLSD